MSEIGLTGIAAIEAESRDRLAAKNAEIERLRNQLVRAKAALEECCHMAGAHTEADAEDWLDSIREYSRKQLLALTDDLGDKA